MCATTVEPARLDDLDGLRRFVTLVTIVELANHTEAAGAYLRTFGPGDDATLLVYAPTDDAGWAQWLMGRVLHAGGADPETCADIRLRVVDDGPATLDRFARRAHAVLCSDGGGWLPIRRPAYGWDALPGLRAQAERLWGQAGERAGATPPYSYDAAIAHIVDRGYSSEHHARMGSVPEPSLRRAVEALEAHLPPSPPRLLHVGNFVGVSLSYLLHWAGERAGTAVSVDPDLPHRDVTHPQRAVCDLLAHFGLNRDHLLICGYSLEKCFSNDSVVFEGYDPAAAWAAESAPEDVLATLARGGHRFDAAFIDGNHDPAYLRRELEAIGGLLAPGGLLVLDDVDVAWEGIRRLFEEVADGDWPYEPVLTDGRIGILLHR